MPCLIPQATSFGFSFTFNFSSGVCYGVCMHVVGEGCITMFMYILAEARGRIWVSCVTSPPPLKPDTGCWPPPRLQLSWCLRPVQGLQNHVWPEPALWVPGILLLAQKPLTLSSHPSSLSLVFPFAAAVLFSPPPYLGSSLCAAPLYSAHWFFIHWPIKQLDYALR